MTRLNQIHSAQNQKYLKCNLFNTIKLDYQLFVHPRSRQRETWLRRT